jgi:VWFA-related protein
MMPSRIVSIAILIWISSLGSPAVAETASSKSPRNPDQVKIPSRPSKSLFEGEQGKQKTEIHFDPNTGEVTVKFVVQDPHGYFIPNIRRDNFVVYENGVRQDSTRVELERAPAFLALVIEVGGHFQRVNKTLGAEVANACRQLPDELAPDDQLAIFKYADRVEQLADFSEGREALNRILISLGSTPPPEANLYDALIATTEQLRPVNGRKAVVVISSGVDSFSKARYGDALESARRSSSPIYAIGFGRIIQKREKLYGSSVPSVRIDWKRVNREMMEVAKAAGGRAYFPGTTLDLSGIYRDLLENLKVRYVITYKSSSREDPGSPRKVRIALVNPNTGGPLEIVDSTGKTIRAGMIAEAAYTPKGSDGRRTNLER